MIELINNDTFKYNNSTIKLSDIKRWIDLNATGKDNHDLYNLCSWIRMDLIGVANGKLEKNKACKRVYKTIKKIINKGYKV